MAGHPRLPAPASILPAALLRHWHGVGGSGDLAVWREETLHVMLRLIFLLALLIAIPSALYGLYTGHPEILFFDLGALAALAVVTFVPDLPFRWRALGFLLIAYALGFWFLSLIIVVGLAYLLAVPVLAAVLLGLWSGLVALVVIFLTMLLAGYGPASTLPLLGLDHVPFSSWLMISLNYAFVGVILTVASAVLLRRLETALQRQKEIADSLEDGRQRLESLNRELAAEMVERKAAQEQTTRLAEVVEQSRTLTMIADPDGHVIYANRACEEMFGGSDETTAAWHLCDLSAQAEIRDAIAASLHSGERWSGRVVHTAVDGEDREFDATISALEDAAGGRPGFAATLRDVTREQAMERRLRRAERLEATGAFAAGIAHDFNNIIGTILAIAEESRAQLRDGAAVGPNLERIELACQRAADIVRQMLVFGRAGDLVERRPMDLGAILVETLPLLRSAIPAQISLDHRVETDALVRIHPSDVHQVLLNLVTNAVHAMADQREGSLSLRLMRIPFDETFIREHPRLAPGRSHLCLTVTDTGHGIPWAVRERIFDPYFTTKDPGEGTGLGLPSVHGIVTSLGGDIDVYSEPGHGSSFRIYLPEAEGDRPVMEASVAAVAHAPVPAGTGRILLVDDEETILVMTARFLERAGFSVTTAADGSAALALIEAAPHAFDLLVTDLTMPGCSGDELIERAHELRPDLPAILTSGFGGNSRLAHEHGTQPLVTYLEKPYRQQELAGRVRAALGIGL